MGKKQIKALAAAVVLMAAVSIGLLLVLTVITYTTGLQAETARIAVKAVYLLACLAGGIFIGKVMGEKKFLWGLGAGVIYFAVIMALSLAVGGQLPEATELLIVLVLTAPAGMLGGMLS